MFAILPGVGPTEILMLILLGVLLFGRKLPDIGRSVGRTVVEFKKGIGGMEDEINSAGSTRAIEPEPVRPPQRVTPSSSAPKFEEASPSTAPTGSMPPQV